MRGGQHQVLLLLEALRSAGHDSLLLACCDSPLWHAARAAGFLVHPATYFDLWRQSPNAKLVHAHDAHAHTTAALAARCRFVVSRRVAFPVRSSLLSDWKYGRASRFLAVSRFVRAQLEAARIPAAKIDVIYDAVDLPARITEWNPDHPLVALASRDPRKGRDLVEQAAALAGVRVLFSSDLASDLHRASLFVYITRSEGLGSAALLAMSRGVPVIASEIGGLPEVCVNEFSGILVPNEPGAIAAAINRVRSDAVLARRLASNARAHVAAHFTTSNLVHATLAAYERALAS
ncbi:MAG: glycosyltransferase family 4 protein [Acidobacteriaceae bacterium]|nr:glycosyltransferase family 4 protein [Acidobacteriaceae bacterium]